MVWCSGWLRVPSECCPMKAHLADLHNYICMQVLGSPGHWVFAYQCVQLTQHPAVEEIKGTGQQGDYFCQPSIRMWDLNIYKRCFKQTGLESDSSRAVRNDVLGRCDWRVHASFFEHCASGYASFGPNSKRLIMTFFLQPPQPWLVTP